MEAFYKRGKISIVMMVILSMLLQIVGPVIGDYVYAEEEIIKLVDGNFSIEAKKTGGKLSVDWTYVYKPGGETEYELNLDDIFEQYEKGSGSLIADEGKIGGYTVSEEGIVAISIDEDIDKIVDGLLEESEEDESTDESMDGSMDETTTPSAPVDPDDTDSGTGATDTNGDDDSSQTQEGKDPADTDGDDSARIIENLLGLFSKNVVYADGTDGEPTTHTFSGNFEVEEAGKKENGFARPSAMPLEQREDLGDIFTSVELIINNESIDSGSSITIENNMEVLLKYQWKIEEDDEDEEIINLNDGDWAKIKIPDAFNGTGLTGELMFGNLVVGGYEIVEDNYLVVTFNHKLVGLGNRIGEVNIRMKFNEDEFKDDASQEILFDEPINKTFNITLKPSGEDYKVDKYVLSDPPPTNAKHIDWVVDVNTTLNELEDATVEDTIPEGLKLDGEIEVFELRISSSGNPVKVEPKLSIEPTIDGNKFKLKLEKTNKAYRIEYRTKITNYSNSPYKNEAILKDKGNKVGGTEKSVEVRLGSLIEKRATTKSLTDPDPARITWEIDVNKAQLNLNDVKVKDEEMDYWLTIDKNSIEVYEIVEDGNRWVTKGSNIESGKLANTTTGFPINLGNVDGKAYRIIFATDIDYKEYHPSKTFDNKAELIVDGTSKDSDSDTATVYRDTILEKNGWETSGYDSQEFQWTIHVNKAKHNLKSGTILTDTIPDGLELDLTSITIKENNTPIFKENLSFSYDEENNKFTMNLNEGKNSYEISYKTKIKNPNITSFNNKVELNVPDLGGTYKDGKGNIGDIGNGKITVDKDAGVIKKNIYKKETVENDSVYNGLDYENKTMSWKITVDAIKEKITELKITDYFDPEKSMVFIEDSLIVKKNNSKIDPANNYTLTPKGVDGFELSFIGELDRDRYDIYYKTSFDPDEVIKAGGTINTTQTFTNRAKFDGETENINNVKKTFTETDDASYTTGKHEFEDDGGKKVGDLDREGRRITWDVYINALGRDLTNKELKIVDTLSEGQVLNEGSLEVYPFTLDKNGKELVDYSSPISKVKYELDPNEDLDGFTLTFKNGIDGPVVIRYTTDIVGFSKPIYKNTAHVTGEDLDKTYEFEVPYEKHDKFIDKGFIVEGINKVYTDDELNWKVVLNTSLSDITNARFIDTISPGHEYVIGSLKVYKGDKLLSKEDYTFLDPPAVNDGETNIEVKLGDISTIYTITYDTVVTAEAGQKISNKAFLVGDDISKESGKDNSFTVEAFSWGTGQGVNKGAISITKIDQDDRSLLEGAGFELWYILNDVEKQVKRDGETIFYTDSNGTLLIQGLSNGREYIIKEVGAPKGYKLGGDLEWTRTVKSGKTKELEVENEKIADDDKKINIPVEKIWKGNYEAGTEVTIILKQDENKKLTLNEGNDWQGNFQDLDKYDENGKEIEYSIKEVAVPGFGTAIVDKDEGFMVINTIEGKVSIPVTKKWIGRESNSVEVILLADGVEVSRATLNVGNDWTHIFEQEQYDENGEQINYTVKEVPLKNYKSTIVKENGSFTITNKYSPPTDRSVRLIKYNRNESRRLEGAIFELQREVNGEYVVVQGYEELITDVNGEIKLGNLPVGKYQFVETKAPRGYDRDRTPITFEITENQNATIELTMTNRLSWSPGPGPGPRPTDPADPKEPEKPVEPTDPEEPEVPVDPTEPTDPTDPTDPVDPTDPTDPTDPEIQETPEEPLIPIVLDPPAKGTVTFDEDGNWTYIPNPGATGKDSFIIVHPDGREELIEIDLDDLPLGTTGIKNGKPILPKTGASSNLVFYITGLLLIALGVFLRKRKTA